MERDKMIADLTETISDAIRKYAHSIAMEKAMLCSINKNITPEDFDEAFEKELAKEWDKVKDKTTGQLAVMGLLEMLSTCDEEQAEELLGRLE